MEIGWQTPANPPEPHDYIIRNGKTINPKSPCVCLSLTRSIEFVTAGKRFVRPYYFEFISHVMNNSVPLNPSPQLPLGLTSQSYLIPTPTEISGGFDVENRLNACLLGVGEEQMGRQNRRRSLHRGIQGTTARLLCMNPSVTFPFPLQHVVVQPTCTTKDFIFLRVDASGL